LTFYVNVSLKHDWSTSV